MGKRNRVKLNIVSVYYIAVIFCACLLVFSISHAKTVTYDAEKNNVQETLVPDKVEQQDEGSIVYYFLENPEENTDECLMFYTNHKFIEVYADDVLIYSRQSAHTIYGNTTGSVWNFVDIPSGCETIKVCIDSAYQTVRQKDVTFYQGNGVDMYNDLLKESMFAMWVSCFNIIIGFAMILFWILVNKHTSVGRELLYLGIFSLIMGMWSFGETDVAALLLSNRVGASFQAFILLLLMGVPFVLFVKHFLKLGDRYFYKGYILFDVGALFTLLLLQFLRIADLKETVFVAHFMMIVAIGYYAYALFRQFKLQESKRRVKVSMIGLIILLIATAGDLITYYQGTLHVDTFGRVGFLVYIILLGMEAAMDSIEKIEEGRKAKIYHELAVTDLLTQTFNRNAYHDDTCGRKNLKDICLFTFDLNNLKACNDTFGHAAGDHYIQDAVKIIKNVFGKYGKLYRIGGDEFCVIVEHCSLEDVRELHDKMQKEEELYNSEDQDILMEIACGYGFFDPECDEDLEDTRERADAMMYHDKEEIKKNMR